MTVFFFENPVSIAIPTLFEAPPIKQTSNKRVVSGTKASGLNLSFGTISFPQITPVLGYFRVG